jgi:hypothetical protein
MHVELIVATSRALSHLRNVTMTKCPCNEAFTLRQNEECGDLYRSVERYSSPEIHKPNNGLLVCSRLGDDRTISHDRWFNQPIDL